MTSSLVINDTTLRAGGLFAVAQGGVVDH